MRLQNLTVIFIAITLPIILMVSLYISTGLKTINYQSLYDSGLLSATHDALYAFEQNTADNKYSDNAEAKRDILKSSVKAFERSLANTCQISAYNTNELEEYIPALAFCMHDGFYMYAPSELYNSQTHKYEYKHGLKNYVYYSETLKDGTVICYSLDNYVTVSGTFNGTYDIKEGYLIDLGKATNDGTKYDGILIDQTDETAVKYYKEAYYFTNWFLNEANLGNKRDKEDNPTDYLKISASNDPEDPNSLFSQHKKKVIKETLESVLNSSITAYSKRNWGQNYKMPKLSPDDWEKVYSNICMISFFQGKSIGLTKYNGYCVLNSTNSKEYVNPNLIYFVDEAGIYHDIRCTKKTGKLTGYKIGDFRKIKVETPKINEYGEFVRDTNGNLEYEYTYQYIHKEEACYSCVNGPLNTNKSVYDYIRDSGTDSYIKTVYWTTLARERYNTPKLLDTACVVTWKLTGLTHNAGAKDIVRYGDSFSASIASSNLGRDIIPDNITVTMNGEELKGGYSYNNYTGDIVIQEVTGDVIITASSIRDRSNTSFEFAQDVTDELPRGRVRLSVNIDRKCQVRVFKFTVPEDGTYQFWSEDSEAKLRITDPWAYLYDGTKYSINNFDEMVLKYLNSQATDTSEANDILMYGDILPEVQNDDYPEEGYNFRMTCHCIAGHTYYLVIRTYSPENAQKFDPIYIERIS